MNLTITLLIDGSAAFMFLMGKARLKMFDANSFVIPICNFIWILASVNLTIGNRKRNLITDQKETGGCKIMQGGVFSIQGCDATLSHFLLASHVASGYYWSNRVATLTPLFCTLPRRRKNWFLRGYGAGGYGGLRAESHGYWVLCYFFPSLCTKPKNYKYFCKLNGWIGRNWCETTPITNEKPKEDHDI